MFTKVLIALVLGTLLVDPAACSTCPHACSGHGTCGSDSTCVCFSGWDAAGDCSLRSCPTGLAWVQKGNSSTLHNSLQECSNNGKCNRLTGKCACHDLFTGAACDRHSCPNNCQNHGVCRPTSYIASTFSSGTASAATAVTTEEFGLSYTNWEASSSYMCECDFGFVSYDCAKRKQNQVVSLGDMWKDHLTCSLQVPVQEEMIPLQRTTATTPSQ